MENNNYNARIINSSFEKLTGKDKLKYMNFSSMIQLDDVVAETGEHFPISVIGFVIVEVHNEKSDNKDYTKTVLVADDGTLYVTGSDSFTREFVNIVDVLKDDFTDAGTIPLYEIDVYKRPSKNYNGKKFLTCGVQ